MEMYFKFMSAKFINPTNNSSDEREDTPVKPNGSSTCGIFEAAKCQQKLSERDSPNRERDSFPL